ncbi:MAG TPA: hypothetical protein VIK94_01245 [Bacilli bacterium]
MNNREVRSLSQLINQAIDAYETLLRDLQYREVRPKKRSNFGKIKEFLFKRVF